MKLSTALYFLLPTLLFSCQPPSTGKEATMVDYEREKAAILSVLDGESVAFWNKDFNKFATYWAHEEYVRTMGWWKNGGVTVVTGWQERAAATRAHMEQSPEPNSTATSVRRENMNLRIFQDVAWATFDQYGEDTGDSLMDMAGRSRETRIFEKIDGEWKIVYVGWLLEDLDK